MAMLTGAQEPLFRKLAPAAAWTTSVKVVNSGFGESNAFSSPLSTIMHMYSWGGAVKVHKAVVLWQKINTVHR